jgi:hypothetical protein
MATLIEPSVPTSRVPAGPTEAGNVNLLVPCSPDGKIVQAIDLGDEHNAMGDFENAWSAYTVALVYWLRLQWMSHKNTAELKIADPEALLLKLRSAMLLDHWAYQSIRSIIRRPTPVGWLQADIVAGIVKAICRTS